MSRILIAVILLFGALARAQEPPPEPTAAPEPTAPEPAAPEAAVRTIQLPLARAIAMALQSNPEIDVARTDPLVATEVLEQALGVYDPIGFGSYDRQRDENPQANAVDEFVGSPPIVGIDTWSYASGVNGIVPLGLTYSSDYRFNRVSSNSGFARLDPEYRAFWTSGISLPLLRDLIWNEANVTVKRSRVGQRISEDQFRATLSSLILSVENQYWNLAATRGEVQVADKSLHTAQELLEQTQVQYDVGVVSRVLVTQAEAGVAEREFNRIVAANAAGNAQDDLLETVAAPDPQFYAETRLVTEDPTYIEYEVDDEVAIAKAMEYRPELAAARNQVEDAEIQLAFAKNQRLPRLDVTASYVFEGLSGHDKDPTNPIDVPDKSWSANNDFFRGDGAHGWSIGARVEIPIGNRTARHRVFQREIELRRASSNFRRVEQNVIVEVRRGARALRSAIEGLQASERRRVAQEETLRAEQERLRLGDSTPFQVLEFEQDLVEAQLQEITSLRVFRDAIAGLEWAQGTLLEERGISVDEEIVRTPIP